MTLTHTHTSTYVTCLACGRRLTEMNSDGAPTKWYERAVGYLCLAEDGGCGVQYDLDGKVVP